jgi:alanine dehydrogenase
MRPDWGVQMSPDWGVQIRPEYSFEVDGVIHYCVANMPGATPRTATIALNNATLRYGLIIADNGLEGACKVDESIISAINT